jgi:hypothetical protein
MKKLLFVLALTLLSVASYAQTKFVRTTDLTIGVKNGKTIDWNPPTKESMLIKIDNNVMVIYSQVVQTFRVIKYDGEYDNGVKRWYCTDEKGINCNLYISKPDTVTSKVTIGIEYLDIAYYYTGYQE